MRLTSSKVWWEEMPRGIQRNWSLQWKGSMPRWVWLIFCLFPPRLDKAISGTTHQYLNATLQLQILNEGYFSLTVDGMWGSWNSWSPCSTTCGYGTRERRRLCDNPKPAYDGKNCLGVGYQKRRCHAYYPCPSTFGFIKTRWFATNFNFFFRFFLLSQFTNRKVSVKIRSKQFYIYQSILPILLKYF